MIGWMVVISDEVDWKLGVSFMEEQRERMLIEILERTSLCRKRVL